MPRCKRWPTFWPFVRLTTGLFSVYRPELFKSQMNLTLELLESLHFLIFRFTLFCSCLVAIHWCRQRFECRFETNLEPGFILSKTCISGGYEREILLVGGGLKCRGLFPVSTAQFHRNIYQLLMYYWLASEGGHQNMFPVEICTCCELCENLDKNS
jgi:hypothetical protein